MQTGVVPSLRSDAGRMASGTLTIVGTRGTWTTAWGAVADMAAAKANSWREHGLNESTVLAFMADTAPAVVLGVIAGWMAGATVLLLPPRMPVGEVIRLCEMAKVRRLCSVNESDLYRSVASQCRAEFECLDLASWPTTRRLVGEGAVDSTGLAVLQATSGSTGNPRLVRVTAANVETNLASIRSRLDFSVEDRLYAWLPLYHDMGLIGFLAQGWSTFVDTILVDPSIFLAQPSSWLRGVAESGATITAAPNFAYGLAARVLSREVGSLDSVRAALCGAEQVQVHTMRRFLDASAQYDFDATALLPVYGLGEATLAVTMPESPRRLLTVDSFDGSPRVALGTALGETRVQISSAGGEPYSDSGIGHVQVQGAHVTDGYLTAGGIDRRHLSKGWLDTGDRGALTPGGELIILGRYKELMILGGRNVAPEPIEEAVSALPGLRAGGVIAFSVPSHDSEQLVVLFEAPEDSDAVHRQVRAAVRDATGETPTTVICTPKSLPRTTSGKLRRLEARLQYLQRQAKTPP